MNQSINIKVNMNSIAINVGGVPLSFSTSEENMARMVKYAEDKEGFLESLSGDLAAEADTVSKQLNESFNAKAFGQYVEIEKKAMKRAYDLMFGDGSFDKLYTKYPDIQSLMTIFGVIGDQLGKALNVEMKHRYTQQQAHVKSVQQNIVSMKQNKRHGRRRSHK
jgi:hypothetical protein